MELIDTITLLFMRYGYHVKNILNSCHAIFKYTFGFCTNNLVIFV